MCEQKYRMLFSPNHNRKPGPKGPSAELVHVVVEMKQRNPRWGCPRIAEQITLAFNLAIDKDVVRRILTHHHWLGQSPGWPSWLTFLGHMIRIETKAGHGAGKPISKIIDQAADEWAFVAHNLKMNVELH